MASGPEPLWNAVEDGQLQSSKHIKEQFAGLAPEIVHKITCENAAKFYGLIN